MKLKKALKFETYKIIKHRYIVVAFFVFFIIFLSITVVYAYSFPLPKRGALSDTEKEDETALYIQQRMFYENTLSFINGENSSLPAGTIIAPNVDYEQQYKYYDYLLTTGTFESEYLGHHEQLFDLQHRGSYIMIEILNILGVVLPLLAIFTTFYVVNSDYVNGTIKNQIASPVGRRAVFTGKSVFLFILIAIIFMLSILCPMIAGLSDSSAKMLLYNSKGYYAQSAFVSIFFPKVLSLAMSMAFWSCIMSFFILIKNRFLSIIAPVLTFGISQLIYYLVNIVIGIDDLIIFRIIPMAFLRYGELYSVLDIFSFFTNGWLTIILTSIFVIALSIASTLIYTKKISRQDLRG